MDAIQRNLDTARRYPVASGANPAQEANAAAYRRNATLQADSPEPANSQTIVTLSRRTQELAAQPEPASDRRTGNRAPSEPQAEQASVEQMAQINAQLRRTYMGAESPGGVG